MAERTVLIVDDQQGVRALLNEVFSVYGFEVHEAPDGYEGLKLLRNQTPDIILLDMKMPGLSGLETLQEMRLINREVPVIIITAYQELEIMDEAIKLGVVDHLIKPFDLDELRNIVIKFAPTSNLQVAGT